MYSMEIKFTPGFPAVAVNSPVGTRVAEVTVHDSNELVTPTLRMVDNSAGKFVLDGNWVVTARKLVDNDITNFDVVVEASAEGDTLAAHMAGSVTGPSHEFDVPPPAPKKVVEPKKPVVPLKATVVEKEPEVKDSFEFVDEDETKKK